MDDGIVIPENVRSALHHLELPDDVIDVQTAAWNFDRLRSAARAAGDLDRAAGFGVSYQVVVAAYWQQRDAIETARQRAVSAELACAAAQKSKDSRDRSETRRRRREAATAWGWPPEWPMRAYETWRRAGRTPVDIQQWRAAGWREEEVRPLARRRQALPQVPEGPAELWRAAGADVYDALHLQEHGVTALLLQAYFERFPPDPDLTTWLLTAEDPAARVAWLEIQCLGLWRRSRTGRV